MEKDWDARFANRPKSRVTASEFLARMPTKVAAVYWMIVLILFFVLQSSGADMIGTGAVLVGLLTVPSSALVIAVTSSSAFDASQATLQPFISSFGTFLILPVLCGGLNAALIFMLVAWIQRRRHRSESEQQ